MRRILARILVLLTVLFLAAACGENEDWQEEVRRALMVLAAACGGEEEGWQEDIWYVLTGLAAARGGEEETWQEDIRRGLTGLAAACGGEAETWRGLTVAPEERCAPYKRADYDYDHESWLLEVDLIRGFGGVYAPYTGRCFRDRSQTDVEHMIALSEAHDSGMCGRTRQEKSRFAADHLNLTLAAPEVNRYEKRHHDAAQWLPEKNRCWFAARVVVVRQKYDLTIDRAEAEALEEVLSGCESTELVWHCTP